MLKQKILKNSTSIHIKCLKRGHDSAPMHVIKSMRKHLKEKEMKKTDEAWLVIDRDAWPNKQLKQAQEWEKQSDNYGLALSNPKFEFWLLLHYEDGKNIENAKECSNRLKNYYPKNQSCIDYSEITEGMINDAVKRAEKIDAPAYNILQNNNSTSVYKLIKNIFKG